MYFPDYKGTVRNDGPMAGATYTYFQPRYDYYTNPMTGNNRPPISGPDCEPWGKPLSNPLIALGPQDALPDLPSWNGDPMCGLTCGGLWDRAQKNLPELNITDVTSANDLVIKAYIPELEKAKYGGLMFFGNTPTGCALYNDFNYETWSAIQGVVPPMPGTEREFSAYAYMKDVKVRDAAFNAARALCRDDDPLTPTGPKDGSNFVLLLTDGAATGPGDGFADPNDKLALYSTCADPKCGATDPKAAGCACRAVLAAQKLRVDLNVKTFVVGFSPDATRGVPGIVNDNIARAGGTCRGADDPLNPAMIGCAQDPPQPIAPVGDPNYFNWPNDATNGCKRCAFRADNEGELQRELEQAIFQSSAGSYSTTPASSVGGIQMADKIEPSRIALDARADFPDWRGHLVAYDTTLPPGSPMIWDAGNDSFFPDPDSPGYSQWRGWKGRHIYTSDGTTMIKFKLESTCDPATSAPCALDPATKTALAAIKVGGTPVFATEVEAERFARWLMGDPAQGNRAVLGAFVNSTPIDVGSPGSSPLPGGKEYFLKYEKRPNLIYAGASDGMLHAFFARKTTVGGCIHPTTGTDLGVCEAGAEAFAYIPPDLLKQMVRLYSQGGQLAAPDRHIFGMASSPKVKSMCVGAGTACTDPATALANWKSVLVVGTGWGQSELMAVDITNPFTWSGNPLVAQAIADPPIQLLWHTEVAAPTTATHDDYDKYFGLTTSVPAFYFGKSANLNDHRLIIASGYRIDASQPLQGQTLLNINAATNSSNQGGIILDRDSLMTDAVPPPAACNPAVFGELTAYTDVAIAKDYNANEKGQILAGYFGDTWGNLWRYVPTRDALNNISTNGKITLVETYGCNQPLHYSPTVVQLDRDNPLNHQREIYLVQVTNGTNDPNTDYVANGNFPESRVYIRKEKAALSGTQVTSVDPNAFPDGSNEILLRAGTNTLCAKLAGVGTCVPSDFIPVEARPTGTPLAILKSDGTGFQFMVLWYIPPKNGCDKGTTYLTLHNVNVGLPTNIVTQLKGITLSNEPVTSTVISGEKVVFIDSKGVNDVTGNLGMTFTVGGALGAGPATGGGLRYNTTGWTEVP